MTEDPEKLRSWATYNRPNFCLLFASSAYLVSTLVVFGIGFATVNEVVDDANANIAFQRLSVDSTRPAPCGLPTTNALHLLQSLNRYERTFGLPQLIEPDYTQWTLEIKTALCAGDQGWISDGNDGNSATDGNEATENPARELRAIAQLTRNWTIAAATPITTDTTAAADSEFERNVCEPDDESSFYSHRLRQAYGDLKTRIARAYVAAGPAFYQYRKRHAEESTLGCLGERNPFQTTMCQNSDHVETVLGRAGHQDAARRLFGDTTTSLPSSTEMMYALLALSVVGHTDRTANNGGCFKNDNAGTPYTSALTFCQSVYDEGEFTADTFDHTILPLAGYAITDAHTKTTERCDRTHYPPSPPSAPPLYRVDNSGTSDYAAVTAVCASLLQYGLFDQGRLFGVPDVLDPFVVDVRVGAASHVLAQPIYNAMYFEVLREGGTALYEPVRRLEAYLVYRIGSLTIWAMLIGCVTGFLALRALAPTAVCVMVRSLETKNRKGEIPFMVRPEFDVSTGLAMVTALLGGYYTLYTDPAVQSNYPITPECDDWMFGQDHSSSGAYVTSWGKRRFSRYGEQLLGVILFVLAGLPIFYAAIATALDKRIEFERKQKTEAVLREDATYWILFGTSVGKQILAAVQTGFTAGDWRELLVGQGDTTSAVDLFARDCKAAILTAFWCGTAVGLLRQRWTVKKLTKPFYFAWAAGTVLLCWTPVFSYSALLSDEWDRAYRTPSGDRTRAWLISLLLGLCIGETIVVLFMLRVLLKSEIGENSAMYELNETKEETQQSLKSQDASEKFVFLGEREENVASALPMRFNLMGLRSSRQRGQYLPVLRLPH